MMTPSRIPPEQIATLRERAAQAIGEKEKGSGPSGQPDLYAALEELRIYGAELEIQNEELQQARAHAEELQQRYFRHFDLAPVGMVRMDDKGIILEANILGASMLGIERSRLASGKVAFAAHVAHGSQAAFHAHLRNAVALRSPLATRKMESCELTLRSMSRENTFVRMQSIVSCGSGERKELLVTLTDLTEHRELEGGLAQQKEIAEAATLAKDLFVAMLSHELRTPLTPVLMLLEELEASPNLSDSDRTLVAVMRRNLKLEVRLIDDLLDLTRISKGKLSLNRALIDAHSCIAPAVGICHHEIVEKRLELQLDLSATQSIVDADSSRLQQVIWNMLRNAVKFTSFGGSISVRSFDGAPGRFTLEVADSGIGLEATSLESIFDPFAQAEPASQRRFGGLGLGLAISRSLVEAQDGALTASSEGLGKGSTFRLDLPAFDQAPLAQILETPIKVSVADRRDLHILLVENHDDTRTTLHRLLTRRGYRVESAPDATSALALCAEHEFDLILSDIGLPDRSGLELMEEIRTQHQVPGIAMSGFGMDSDITKSKAAGFEEHLTKPVEFDELEATLQRVARVRE